MKKVIVLDLARFGTHTITTKKTLNNHTESAYNTQHTEWTDHVRRVHFYAIYEVYKRRDVSRQWHDCFVFSFLSFNFKRTHFAFFIFLVANLSTSGGKTTDSCSRIFPKTFRFSNKSVSNFDVELDVSWCKVWTFLFIDFLNVFFFFSTLISNKIFYSHASIFLLAIYVCGTYFVLVYSLENLMLTLMHRFEFPNKFEKNKMNMYVYLVHNRCQIARTLYLSD